MARPDDSPPPALAVRWQPFAVAWTVFWALMIAVAVLTEAMRSDKPLWQPLLWESSSCLVASVLIVGAWRLLARLDRHLHRPRRWFLVALAPLPLLAPAFIVVLYSLRHAVYALLGQTYRHDPWGALFVHESLRLAIFYGLFTAVLFGVRSHALLAAERLRAEQALALQQRAQLLQLAQQIEPHFLFNALNTIAATVHESAARADALITQLAALLRAATDLARRPTTTLDEELALLQAYAAIMLERFGDRVTLQWSIAPEARRCSVPTLLLQPLLENVFRHGVERRGGPVAITVSAQVDGARLRLAVDDDAGLLPEAPVDGVGLSNLRQRLAALYGDRASLRLAPRAGGGASAALELPCLR